MNLLTTLLRGVLWPVRGLQRLLSFQVRLRWQARALRLVIETPEQAAAAEAAAAQAKPAKVKGKAKAAAKPAVGPAAEASPSAAAKDADAGSAKPNDAPAAPDGQDPMHAELHQLLAQHGATRKLMRHLAYLERTLRLAGPDALPSLPLDVLKKSLAQLEDLVADWSSPGLAQLRLQITMVVADKEDESREFHPSVDMLSDFTASRRMQVSEASASDFEAAAQAWAPTMPPEPTTPAAAPPGPAASATSPSPSPTSAVRR
jgi:hypothetical protein